MEQSPIKVPFMNLLARLVLVATVSAFAVPVSGEDAANQPAAAVLEVDPAQPFGEVDTNLWYLAQYLSGSQADAARWEWFESLSEADQSEMGARCQQISADLARFDEDARLICITVHQVLNRRNSSGQY